jgi:hypothetical protein
MSTQYATTTTDTPDTRPEWQVRLNMLSPRRTTLLLRTAPEDPFPDGFVHWRAAHFVMGEAVDHVPEGLDLGHDDEGRPIIAFEALGDVVVRDPDGRERPIEIGYRDGHGTLRIIERLKTTRVVLGAKTLDEFERRQRAGEGVVETWLGPAGLRLWAWNDAVELAEDEREYVFDREEDDPDILQVREADD